MTSDTKPNLSSYYVSFPVTNSWESCNIPVPEKKFTMPNDQDFLQKLNYTMQNTPFLAPEIFDHNDLLFSKVRNKLLEICHSMQQRFTSVFPLAQIQDILLTGSLCSYIYNNESDLDMFVLIDDIIPHDTEKTKKILKNFNVFFSNIYFRPKIYKYPVDFGLLLPSSPQAQCRNKYSLLQNKWINKPVYREFSFTTEELHNAYYLEYKKLEKFMNALPRNSRGLFPKEYAVKADGYLSDIRHKAFDAKEYFKTREYSLEYNIYRLLKHCHVYSYYKMLIIRSYNQE